MRYRVKTPEGELDYLSMREVELAYIQGLVGPDDEVLEEGTSLWRKASSIPVLVKARPPPKGLGFGTQALTAIFAGLLGFISLMLLWSESPTRRGVGLFLALATAMMLGRVTYKAFKRPGGPKA